MRALMPLSIERYARYLERVLALYAPLEDALWSCPTLRSLVPDADQRRKTGWLREDLEALGHPLDAGAPAPAVLRSAGLLEQLGAAYVLEGATLGGGVLLRRLRSGGLPLDHGRSATRFLSGYGAETSARWHAFRSVVHRAACSHADRTRIGAGALDTFRAFEATIAQGAR